MKRFIAQVTMGAVLGFGVIGILASDQTLHTALSSKFQSQASVNQVTEPIQQPSSASNAIAPKNIPVSVPAPQPVSTPSSAASTYTPAYVPTYQPDTQSYDDSNSEDSSYSDNNSPYSGYTNVDGNYIPSPSISGGTEGGYTSTYTCSDGTYSYAQHSQGACSHHGGIQ